MATAAKKTATPIMSTSDSVALTTADVGTIGAQNADGSAVVASHGNSMGYIPRVKKILTLPLLKLKIGEPVYIKFTAPLFVGKLIEDSQTKEPPTMANVINLPTGELVQIMLGSVLQGILKDDYPGDGFVGKSFMVTLAEKKRGKGAGTYNTYSVAELED